MSGHWSVVDGAAMLGAEKFSRYEDLSRRGKAGEELSAPEMSELKALGAELDAAVYAAMRARETSVKEVIRRLGVERCVLEVDPFPGEEHRDILMVRVLSFPDLRQLGGFWLPGEAIKRANFDLLTAEASAFFARYGGRKFAQPEGARP